jgi:RNA binding exosome subunit
VRKVETKMRLLAWLPNVAPPRKPHNVFVRFSDSDAPVLRETVLVEDQDGVQCKAHVRAYTAEDDETLLVQFVLDRDSLPQKD